MAHFDNCLRINTLRSSTDIFFIFSKFPLFLVGNIEGSIFPFKKRNSSVSPKAYQ